MKIHYHSRFDEKHDDDDDARELRSIGRIVNKSKDTILLIMQTNDKFWLSSVDRKNINSLVQNALWDLGRVTIALSELLHKKDSKIEE